VSLLSLVGDCTTTTCLALVAGWPTAVTIVEADPSGGSLGAWLDTPSTPSLATIVANTPTSASTIDSMTQHSSSGTRFISAPVRARSANIAISEAESTVFPLLSGPAAGTVLADVGRLMASAPVPTIVGLSDTIIVVHRQCSASAAASTVRLDRLVEVVEQLAQLGSPIQLLVIGSDPFDPDEISGFVADAVPDALVANFTLPDDQLAAAVLAGRRGVSAKRLRRLPLMRAAAAVATSLDNTLGARIASISQPAEPGLRR